MPSIEFAKTVSSQKVLGAWLGTSSQSAWCLFLNVHCHRYSVPVPGTVSILLVLKTIFVTEALLHPSLLFVCCPPFCELTPEYSRLMIIIFCDFNYFRRFPSTTICLSSQKDNGFPTKRNSKGIIYEDHKVIYEDRKIIYDVRKIIYEVCKILYEDQKTFRIDMNDGLNFEVFSSKR